VEQEAQGQSVNLNMTIKAKQTVLVNFKTSIVKNIDGTTDTEGTMEMMGQNVPMTMSAKKTTSVK
jgi:hypothetical protein